jgi:(p)ppGpp synthase/HD superfamily hydrolase
MLGRPPANLEGDMRLVEKASVLSMKAHEYQVYGDRPYFDAHIIPVVNTVTALGGSNFEIALAYLHDTVEDTGLTRDEIRYHFGDAMLRAVDAMTRLPDESYESYLNNLVGNKSAIIVKLADAMCNLSASLQELSTNPGDKVVARVNKYAMVVGRLSRYVWK